LLARGIFHTDRDASTMEPSARANDFRIDGNAGTLKTRTRSNFPGGSVSANDTEPSEVTKWDPGLTERVIGLIRPLIKGWHRSEVRGLENVPPGGVLVVSNHSGGLFAMDVPVFATDFYEKYGYDRPIYTL